MSDLNFGWHVHSFPVDGSSGPDFLQQITRTLDLAAPFLDSAWVDDHVMPWATWQSNDTPYIECATTMAYLAARYPTLHFGSSVFCQSYRNPALLGKMAANLQWLTGGRFIFGIGAGWMAEEYEAYNWNYPKASVRIAQLEETVELIKALWGKQPASYEGKYYRMVDAYCEPKPDPIPPILIGGGGEQLTLRVVAQHADMWNLPGGTLENYAHNLDVLRGHCEAIGRDYDEIIKTWSCESIALARTEAEAREIAAASPYNNNTILGTPAQVARQLQPFIDLGVEHLIVRLIDFPETRGIELFIDEVMPRLATA